MNRIRWISKGRPATYIDSNMSLALISMIAGCRIEIKGMWNFENAHKSFAIVLKAMYMYINVRYVYTNDLECF